ncbi:MAG TPA: GFA family protein [Sphingomonas sp.]|nr:GFA family protein [Sphingomonas sp.]
MNIAGSCQCEAVRITATAEPLTTRACWCRDCQKLAAGGATQNAFFRTEEVTIEGEVRWHDVLAESGNKLARGFCPVCGTHVLVQSHVRRHLIGVRIGVFGDTSELGPKSLIWVEAAPAWAKLDPDLPKVDRQPPPLG